MYQHNQQDQMVDFAEIVAGIALVVFLLGLGSGATLLLVRKYPKLGKSVPALGAIANIAQSGINQIMTSNRRGDQGAASLNKTYPDVKSWFSKSTDSGEPIVLPSRAPGDGAAPSNPVAPLGAKAPTVSEAYGFANPISAQSKADPPMAEAEKEAGTRASDEYDSAKNSNMLRAADGSDGRGTDKTGVIGADLQDVYGNLLKEAEDFVARAAEDAERDPIKGKPEFDSNYDDDATLLTDAYGSAFAEDGTEIPSALTPQGIVNGINNVPSDLQVKVTQNAKNFDLLRGAPKQSLGLRRSERVEDDQLGAGPSDPYDYVPSGGKALQRQGASMDQLDYVPSGGRSLVRMGASNSYYPHQSIQAY
jgi:hypothetical protein